MSHAVSSPQVHVPYDDDLVLWAEEQARLLRDGRVGQLDIVHLIEQVEGVGPGQRDAVEIRLKTLLTRLLMWKYLPGARLQSWKGDIDEEREGIARLLRMSPSLDGHLARVFDSRYRASRLRAASETGIDYLLLPESAPFTLAQAVDRNFMPREPDLEAYD